MARSEGTWQSRHVHVKNGVVLPITGFLPHASIASLCSDLEDGG